MLKSCIFICLIMFIKQFVGIAAIDCSVEPRTNEARLRKTLFCNYDKTSRPILTDGPIAMKIKMIVKSFAFDDTSNKLTISSWLAMSWTDEHLKWNAKDYNIETITQFSEEFWQPDLALYNSDVASSHNEFCKSASCVITANGLVSCIPPCSHDAKCQPNYKRWPFDTQNCSLHIGTWVNSGEEIDYKVLKSVISESDLDSQNREWRLFQATYHRIPGNFSESKTTYPSLMFTFSIERHSGIQAALILGPAIVFVLFNLISFWIDSANIQRTIILVISLYAHLYNIEQLVWLVPHNGDDCPYIVIFFRDSLVITGLLILNTLLVRGLTLCSIQTPSWVENITSFMGSNRLGQVFLTRHLIDKQSFHSEVSADDGVNLVESQTQEQVKTKGTSPWQTFANIVDRVLFAVLTVVYIIMIIGLIPEGYLGERKKSIEIIGY